MNYDDWVAHYAAMDFDELYAEFKELNADLSQSERREIWKRVVRDYSTASLPDYVKDFFGMPMFIVGLKEHSEDKFPTQFLILGSKKVFPVENCSGIEHLRRVMGQVVDAHTPSDDKRLTRGNRGNLQPIFKRKFVVDVDTGESMPWPPTRFTNTSCGDWRVLLGTRAPSPTPRAVAFCLLNEGAYPLANMGD